MKLAFLAFSDTGEALAKRITAHLGDAEAAYDCTVSRCPRDASLAAWTERNFADAGGLVFIGAAGIAVRAIAPHVKSKTTDPAVVVVDESGKYAISLLSGHLGGGNELTERIAAAAGAAPVITTATDTHGLFAVDDWARKQRLHVHNKAMIKEVSAAILRGETVPFISAHTVLGTAPAGIAEGKTDPRPEGAASPAITLSVRTNGAAANPHTLLLVPEAVCIGIGCRKGIAQEVIEEAWQAFLKENELSEEAVCTVSTIDLKKHEEGLIAFCKAHDWPLRIYSADQLIEAPAVPGGYTPSAFVEQTTGVANVCERCAVYTAEEMAVEEEALGHPQLLVRKTANNGVTLAAAVRPLALRWE